MKFANKNAHAKCIEVRKYLGVARGPFCLGIGRGTISIIAIAKQNELMGRCSQIALGLLCCGTKLSGRLRPGTYKICNRPKEHEQGKKNHEECVWVLHAGQVFQ